MIDNTYSDDKNDRVCITKAGELPWAWISNPRVDLFTQAADSILMNEFNEYVEYANCGAVSRIVRRSDLPKYGIDKNEAVGLSRAELRGMVFRHGELCKD